MKTKISWILFFVSLNSFSQFIEKVDFIGACGNQDWTKDWTDFTPIAEVYPEADVVLKGTILKDTQLTASHTYRISGKIYVTNNATLTIQAGTIFRADFKSAILITPGSKIIAVGTNKKPIVFTSAQPIHERNKGDWGGLIILGKAKVNLQSGKGIAEGDLDPSLCTYGGDNDHDSSGILRYVRVEFAGRRINKDHEFNGISFYAVGDKTQVDFIMSSYSGDDGIQFFGGAVNCKHLVSFQSGDDCFEYSEGYHGKQQFGISLRHFQLGDVHGSRSIDGQSSMSGNLFLEIPTTAQLSNFTLISPEIFYSTHQSENVKDAIHYEGGAAFSIYNSVIIGFPIGINIQGQESLNFIENQTIQFRNNLLIGCNQAMRAEDCAPYNQNIIHLLSMNNNIKRKFDVTDIFQQPFSLFKPDFTLRNKSLQMAPIFDFL